MQEQLVHLKTGDADSVLPHFSEKFPEYIAHQRKELATLLQPEGSKYARYTLAAASRAFLDIVSARPLLDCRPKNLQEFARVLARVPANHAKLQRFARLTLREAADANDGLDKPYRTLGAETIRRQYVGPIKYGFEWMCGDERAFSPLASARLRAPKGAQPSRDRHPISPAQAVALFAMARERPRPDERWLADGAGIILAVDMHAMLGTPPGCCAPTAGLAASTCWSWPASWLALPPP